MSRMRAMTAQERIEDISKRSGLSIEICRRVLNAETASAIDSLKRGERTTLSGRVTLRPEFRTKVGVGLVTRNVLKVKATVSDSLEAALSDLQEFETDGGIEETEDNGIRLRQISSLL